MFPHMVFIVESPKSPDYRCLAIGLTYVEPGDDDNDEPLMRWVDGQEERWRSLVVTGPADFDEATGSWTWEGTEEYAGTWRARVPELSDASWIYPNKGFHFADEAEFYEVLVEAMDPDGLEPEDMDPGES
jgi:hypothetical protein